MKYFIYLIIITGVLMGNTLPKYYTKTLNNGLKIVVIPINKNSNVITTDIFYKVGSGDEIMGKSGIAHMLEHMNFKSTKHLKAGEFDKIVKGFGGVDNASTGFDYTQYYITSSSKNAAKSLKLFSELMANLNLKNKEFQTERKVVLEERYWRTDNSPMGYLYFRLFNNAYLYNSYHWTPIGFIDDIKNWTIKDIRHFHKMYYQPKNAVIVVSGDIDPKTVFKYAKKYFGKIKNSGYIRRSHQKEPVQDGEKNIIIRKDTQVQMIAIAYHIPDFRSKDQIALSAIGELLSRGKSSRLIKELVDKKREVNQIFAYNMENKAPGLFLIIAVCNPGIDAKVVEKNILNEIEKIKKGDVKEKELEKIKINTKADFVYSLESSSSVASLFGSYFAKGDIKPLLEYEKNINSLSLSDIKKIANKYFNKKNSTILILKKDEK